MSQAGDWYCLLNGWARCSPYHRAHVNCGRVTPMGVVVPRKALGTQEKVQLQAFKKFVELISEAERRSDP